MKTFKYIIYRLNLDNVWEASHFELNEDLTPKKALLKASLNLAEIVSSKEILIAFLFFIKEDNLYKALAYAYSIVNKKGTIIEPIKDKPDKLYEKISAEILTKLFKKEISYEVGDILKESYNLSYLV